MGFLAAERALPIVLAFVYAHLASSVLLCS
jgi:hypothetical protein